VLCFPASLLPHRLRHLTRGCQDPVRDQNIKTYRRNARFDTAQAFESAN
jgi:hypothetical protein